MDAGQVRIIGFAVPLPWFDGIPLLAFLGNPLRYQQFEHTLVSGQKGKRLEVGLPVTRLGHVETHRFQLALVAVEPVHEPPRHVAPAAEHPSSLQFRVPS
jgi:hypothetical protein